ncbi:Ubiquitin--protein ligase [Bertholletia excelsa]
MGRDDLYISVPSVFRCPISLDVMKSPVSLCTGVTYDRSSIQRWLDSGNNTCPATMQVLQTKDFVPNHTLHRLIESWSASVRAKRFDPNTTATQPLLPPSITQEQARELVTQIQHVISNNSLNQNCFDLMSKLVCFAKDSDENRKFLVTIDGLVSLLVEIIGNSNIMIANTSYAEETFQLLELVLREYKDREYIKKMVIEKKDSVILSMLFVLQEGNLASRIAGARILELVATDTESKLHFSEHSNLISELLSLAASSESDSEAIEAALSSLICISMPRRARVRLVRQGAVKVLGKLLSDSNMKVEVNERVLKVLEMVMACKEGREEICRDEVCVSAIVKKMLKVSTTATEHAVTILWSLCYVLGDQMAQEAVARSNGLTKILLLMQSNCSVAVRQMASDLLKLFGVKSKSCLSTYDTKTTHIMPF